MTGSATSLLERDVELDLIEERIREAALGRGSVLLIEGPAGIGKTELLGAARACAKGAGMDALAARGGELEQSLGFGIVRQLFEARIVAATAAERRRLLAGAAALAGPAVGVLGAKHVPEGLDLPLGDPAAAINHGLYWLTANLAEEGPLLLTVDDLHWADAASARWLIYLARRLDGLPVYVAAAMRPGEPGLDPKLGAALHAEAAAAVLRPSALSEEGSSALVHDWLGDSAEPEFCRACHRASGGNPFLLGELLQAVEADAIAPTAASTAAIVALAPETVSGSTLLRIARLPEGAEPLARAVAVLGAEAEPRHAAALAELKDGQVAIAADALAAVSILAPDRPLRFAHPLLRTAVYEQIPHQERALAHLRAAHLIAAEGGSPSQVAAQLLASEPGGGQWVVDALVAAAADAVDRDLPGTAVTFLRRALIEPQGQVRREELLRALLAAADAASDWSAFDGITDDPVEELTRERAGLIAVAEQLGHWLFYMGRLDESRRVLGEAIQAANEAGDHRLAIRLESVLLSLAHFDPEEASARLEAYAGRVPAGSAEERVWLGRRAWWQHFGDGPAAESADLARLALAGGSLLAKGREKLVFDQQALHSLLVLMRTDQLELAGQVIDEAVVETRERGSALGFLQTMQMRGYLAYRRGDLASAIEDQRAALEMSQEQGVAPETPISAAWLVDALIERGELAEAERWLEETGMLGELQEHYWFIQVRFSRGCLRLAQGRTVEGLEDLWEYLFFHRQTRPAVHPVASTIAVALAGLPGADGDARPLADWELERARKWGTPRVVGIALRAAGVVEGGTAGIQLLREAVHTLARSPARLEHARALVDMGAALRRANRRQEARVPLKESLEMAHRLGATVIEEHAREELAATGARPRRVMLSGVESLTPSELRVARMAAEGMENKEIAQALFVSAKTVETHLGHAYGKLEISSRKELRPALVSGSD